MSRTNITIGVVVIVIVGIAAVAAVAALAYAFLRPTEKASAPIEAIPLSTTVADASDTETDSNNDDSGSSDVDTDSGDAAEVAVASDNGELETGASGPVLFEIVQAESEARFILNEVLRGDPNTVVGATDQVAGEILFNPADPASARVGTILVNARTLATDDDRRNRAMGNRILDTGAYEFISFTPTSISGLPESVRTGDGVTFQLTGDLTIRDVSTEVTFQATVIPVSDDRLEGMASATVLRGDYRLIIPSVPFVANVDEEVMLELDFVALRVD